MKILVTGSSGHLGSALVRVLKQKQHNVSGTDILPSEFTEYVGSITNRSFVRDCMRGITHVLHTATLHKPHVESHSRQQFIDTNITGTLNLLEESVNEAVQGFVFTSTTSSFGDALTPLPGSPSAWITEATMDIPKNIYGFTKTAAEDLCRLFHRNQKLPVIVLRTSRFFPETDDDPNVALGYADDNVKANEYLYRRVDIEDVVNAHLLALEKAVNIGFDKYIISASSPFLKDDLEQLNKNASIVVEGLFPEYAAVYKKLGWKMFPTIERVYVNHKAREELGWEPGYDFGYILNQLKKGEGFKSDLAILTGSKGYHHDLSERSYLGGANMQNA